MSLNSKLWILFDTALRVPPILFVDLMLRCQKYLTPETIEKFFKTINFTVKCKSKVEEHSLNSTLRDTGDVEEYGLFLMAGFLAIQVLIIAVFIFIFNTKQLISIYIRLSSVAIIYACYKINRYYVYYFGNLCSHEPDNLGREIGNYIFHGLLAILFSVFNSVDILPQGAVIFIFIIPTLSCTFSLPAEFQMISPILTAGCCICLLFFSMWIHGLRVCETLFTYVVLYHGVVENYIVYNMIESHWGNLHIAQVFRIYWVIRCSDYTSYLIYKNSINSILTVEFLKGIINHGSENIVAILGMASFVSLISQTFSHSLLKFLKVSDQPHKNIGNICAFLFILLCVQTGITSLESNERFYRICRNFCLLYIALLHFVLNRLNPILMSLSASQSPYTNKNARALITALFLIITPILILVHQWKTQEPSAWLFALTSLMLELIIKTTVLVSIYILFTIDTHKNGLWENLEDYVYYLRIISSLSEIILGIYLLVNGIFIILYESRGAIRAFTLCLHAYFNIWIQGKTEWESFLQRKTAQNRISFLEEATEEQLMKNNDVCSICFQNMSSARVTKCNHFFHGVCLRKWLNVQDTCPLCSTSLYNSLEKQKEQTINL